MDGMFVVNAGEIQPALDFRQPRGGCFLPDEKKAGSRYVTIAGNVKVLDGVERVMVPTDGRRIPIDDIG